MVLVSFWEYLVPNWLTVWQDDGTDTVLYSFLSSLSHVEWKGYILYVQLFVHLIFFYFWNCDAWMDTGTAIFIFQNMVIKDIYKIKMCWIKKHFVYCNLFKSVVLVLSSEGEWGRRRKTSVSCAASGWRTWRRSWKSCRRLAASRTTTWARAAARPRGGICSRGPLSYPWPC